MDDLTHLAIRAGQGDSAALDAFVRAALPDVWRLCRRLGDESNAEDLAQETLLRAIRALPAFRAESSARTWVLSIARRTCADRVREHHRSERLIERISGRRHESVELPCTDIEVIELLGALEPERREAIVLTQELGLSYVEAAEVVGVAVGTIRSRVFRARGDLLDMLARRDVDQDRPASGST